MKKLSTLVMTVIILFTTLSPLQGYAAQKSEPADYGKPVEVRTYQEEDGSTVTEKIYFVPDTANGGISLYSTSGSGWYKNEKQHTWGSGTVMTYYAKGYFTWGNGNVRVSSPSGSVSGVPSTAKVSNRITTSGTGKYAGIFNKYAYVTFSFSVTNLIGLTSNYSVTVRVSQSGNNI